MQSIHIYIYIYIHIYIFAPSADKQTRNYDAESPATTEFRTDAPTDWAIRPWAQLALRVNCVQLLQFHLFAQCSSFISVIAFVSRHICFKRNFAQVITWVQRHELIHIVFTTEGFWEVAIESWGEWDLNPRPLNSVQTL